MPNDTRATLIRQRIAAQVTGITVIYENDGQSQPATSTAATLWAEAFIRDGESEFAALGGSEESTVGVLIFNVFGSLGQGETATRARAASIKNSFKNVDLGSGLVFGMPSVQVVGESGGWFQVNVNCPFYQREAA